MSNNLSQRMGFDVERLLTAAFSGAYQKIGTPITQNPVVIVFDNQSTVAVVISIDGVNNWKTFVSGEAFVLDCRANVGIAPNMTIDIGTQFYGMGSAGTGQFSIAIVYAL